MARVSFSRPLVTKVIFIRYKKSEIRERKEHSVYLGLELKKLKPKYLTRYQKKRKENHTQRKLASKEYVLNKIQSQMDGG